MENARSTIANASETLRTARMGLDDFLSPDPARRIPGFRNAVVLGRAVTNVLEHLRGKVEDFDAWYKPRSTALGQDSGFARLYKLRSEILKEGTGGPALSVHFEHLIRLTWRHSCATHRRMRPTSSSVISPVVRAGK